MMNMYVANREHLCGAGILLSLHGTGSCDLSQAAGLLQQRFPHWAISVAPYKSRVLTSKTTALSDVWLIGS